MKLNVHNPAAAGDQTAKLTSADVADNRVLVVDDEDAVRRLFASEPFALVLSDVQMPGLNGIGLLRKLTENFPDTAVVLVSGIDRTQRVLDAVRLGAYDYLLKPCDLGVLELTVERALERRRLLRDGKRYKKGFGKAEQRAGAQQGRARTPTGADSPQRENGFPGPTRRGRRA